MLRVALPHTATSNRPSERIRKRWSKPLLVHREDGVAVDIRARTHTHSHLCICTVLIYCRFKIGFAEFNMRFFPLFLQIEFRILPNLTLNYQFVQDLVVICQIFFSYILLFFIAFVHCRGHTVAQFVEALRYKSEGRGFALRWGHCEFPLT